MGGSQSADRGADPTVSPNSREKKSKELLGAVKSVSKCESNDELRDIFIKIKLLLEAGADSRAQDNESRTCLHHIAMRWKDEYDDIIQSMDRSHGDAKKFVDEYLPRYFLVRGDRDVHMRDRDGRTSLHWAAYRGNTEIVRSLLSAGADPDVRDKKGRTPLKLVTRKRKCRNQPKFMEIANILVGVTKNGTTILQRSCQRNDAKLVKPLLRGGASLSDVNENGFNALLHAVKSSNQKIVRKLIDEGADVNYVNRIGVGKDPSTPMTALHIAIMQNNMGMLRYLLKHGADPNRTNKIGRSILSFTAEARPKIKKHPTKDMTLEKMELLLSRGADLYDGGLGFPESPFEWLVSRNRVAEVELFFKHGLDIGRYSPRTPSDFSPLHEAVRCSLGTGGCAMLSLFLQHDSKGLLDLEYVDALGRSPICLAAEVGSPQSVKLLIDRGADIDHVEGTNRSPLELASALSRDDSSELECIKLLVSSGARLRNILEELSPRNADDEAKDRLWDKAKCVIKYRVLYESQRSVDEPIENLSMPVEFQRDCETCRAEIALLRNSHIYIRPTHYDLLTDKSFLEHVTPHGSFELFNEEDFKVRFPLYGQDLCDRFKCVKDMQSAVMLSGK